MKDLKNALWEACKEPARLLLLSAIPVLLTWLSGTEWKYAGIAILVLRFIDKFVHEYRSNVGTEGTYKGLIGF